MRLIDADALNGYQFGLISPYAQNLFHKTINDAPTVVLEQEPCTDVISRQAFGDAIEKAQYSLDFCKKHHIDYSISMEMVRIILHDLPPVTAEKVGQWENHKCSACGYGVMPWNDTPYCPNCGTKMQEVEDGNI